VEQGDWTEQEVETARAVVQQLWPGEYRQSALGSGSQPNSANSSETTGAPVRRILLDEAEEHHRQWQPKRRRITSGITHSLVTFVTNILDNH